MILQLIILLLVARLSLNAELAELEKQMAAFKLKMERQDTELKQLKNITEIQNEKISLLHKLNTDLQQELRNHSSVISDLQNQQEQLENLTKLLQKKDMLTELDDRDLQQDLNDLFNISNNQHRQIQFLWKELRENDTKLRQIMEAEMVALDNKYLNITNNHFQQMQNFTARLNQNTSKELLNILNKSQKQINKQNTEIAKINNIFEHKGWPCQWHGQDISLSKCV